MVCSLEPIRILYVYVGQQKKDSYLKEKGRNLDLKILYLSMEKDKTYFDGIMVGVLITILIYTAFLGLVLYNLK